MTLNSPKNTLISVLGATASGKTSLAIKLANWLNAPIVSADSRQFYREMSIGTAVPSADELAQAAHYLIQHKSIQDTYTVGDYAKEALTLLDQLFAVNPVVILVGGSGLYIQALTQGLDEFPEVAPEHKTYVEALWKDRGIEALQKLLRELDPEYAKTVDLQNPMRLIRALSVCLSCKQPYSHFLGKAKPARNFKNIALGIEGPRTWLHQRINLRVDQMVASGLFQEAASLYEHRDLNALKTVGYTEVFAYMNGLISEAQAIEDIKTNTRRYAKRQGTWFRRQPDIHWVTEVEPQLQAISALQGLGITPA